MPRALARGMLLSDAMMTHDKRRPARLPADIAVAVVVGGRSVLGTVVNVSPEGARVSGPHLTVGSRIHLVFPKATVGDHEVDALVVRASPTGAGIRFLKRLTPEWLDALLRRSSRRTSPLLHQHA
jgi:hypothetical protein